MRLEVSAKSLVARAGVLRREEARVRNPTLSDVRSSRYNCTLSTAYVIAERLLFGLLVSRLAMHGKRGSLHAKD